MPHDFLKPLECVLKPDTPTLYQGRHVLNPMTPPQCLALTAFPMTLLVYCINTLIHGVRFL